MPKTQAAFILFIALLAVGQTAAETVARRGSLIFPDGNRITGVLGSDGAFASDRFGHVSFKTGEAYFEASDSDSRPPEATAQPVANAATAVLGVTSPVNPSSTSVTPWKFTVNGFFEMKTEGNDDNREFNVGVSANKKWTSDQLGIDSRYEYLRKNDRIDTRRATVKVDWQHSLSSRWFTLYRPYAEYDGRNLDNPLLPISRLNYLLFQHQAGLGYRYINSDHLQGRVGAAWSYFTLHVYHFGDFHTDAPSMFLEHDFQLPWGFEFTQRGELYYSYHEADEPVGVSNEFNFTKRFGAHYHLTLRHEYRYNFPVSGTNDIRRLRLLFGVDF